MRGNKRPEIRTDNLVSVWVVRPVSVLYWRSDSPCGTASVGPAMRSRPQKSKHPNVVRKCVREVHCGETLIFPNRSMRHFDPKTIKSLTVFFTVAKHRNISRASEELHLTQPAVSSSLIDLEDRIGVKLFVRGPRGVTLTDAGETLLPEVESFLKHAAMMEQVMGALKQSCTKVLTMSAIHDAMLHWCPTLRGILHAEHPEIGLVVQEVSTREIEPMLERDEIALGVGFFDRLENPTFCSRVLLHETPVAILPVDHPLTSKSELTFDDLRGERFVWIGRRETRQYFDALLSLLSRHNVHPSTDLQVRSPYEQIANVSSGQGIGLVPHTFKSHLPDSVVTRPVADAEPCWTLRLVWNPKKANPTRDLVLRIIEEKGLAAPQFENRSAAD